MLLDVKSLWQTGLHPADKQFFELVWCSFRPFKQLGPVPHHLAAHDFMDPGVIDIQLAQFVRQRRIDGFDFGKAARARVAVLIASAMASCMATCA